MKNKNKNKKFPNFLKFFFISFLCSGASFLIGDVGATEVIFDITHKQSLWIMAGLSLLLGTVSYIEDLTDQLKSEK